MKEYAIVYSSRTGNTKKIAEAMYDVAPESFDLLDAKNVEDLSQYKLVVFGYGVDKAGPYENCRALMSTIKNQFVVLFHTLGADPKSDHAFACAANGGACLGEGNRIIGYFSCQGAIDPQLIARMRQMKTGPHASSPESEARWAKAASHPDETDVANAKAFMKKTLMMFEAHFKR